MSEQICPTEYWQKSRFVDHRQYQNRPEEWKEEMRQLEATTIRGGGAVGSPACNVLFKIEGQHANQYRDAIIDTIAELTALRKERDALKEAGHGLVIAMKSEMVTCDSPYCKCQTCRAVSVFIAALSEEGTPQEKMVTALRKLKKMDEEDDMSFLDNCAESPALSEGGEE